MIIGAALLPPSSFFLEHAFLFVKPEVVEGGRVTCLVIDLCIHN